MNEKPFKTKILMFLFALVFTLVLAACVTIIKVKDSRDVKVKMSKEGKIEGKLNQDLGVNIDSVKVSGSKKTE